MQIAGTFDIASSFEPPFSDVEGVTLGRATFTKRFHGPLEATSEVTFLAGRTPHAGSAGYVALERVTGQLAGRAGTFLLAHLGLMDRGASTLTVTVIPDSGTGALAGLRGTMTIEIVEGAHHYAFTYELPGT